VAVPPVVTREAELDSGVVLCRLLRSEVRVVTCGVTGGIQVLHAELVVAGGEFPTGEHHPLDREEPVTADRGLSDAA
jgi:hypothetical protein